MKKGKTKLTLDQEVTYQIKVPGEISKSWPGWDDKIRIDVDHRNHTSPTTTLTCIVDQAGLHGLLRSLYSMGLPLISVNFIACDPEDKRYITKDKE